MDSIAFDLPAPADRVLFSAWVDHFLDHANRAWAEQRRRGGVPALVAETLLGRELLLAIVHARLNRGAPVPCCCPACVAGDLALALAFALDPCRVQDAADSAAMQAHAPVRPPPARRRVRWPPPTGTPTATPTATRGGW